MLGGTILDVLSWQWLFAINIIPGTVALLLAWKALPRATASDTSPFDVPGALLSVILLGSMIMAANSVENRAHAISTVCWALVATVSLIAFVWHIRRARNPILPPVIFSNGRFTLAR
ncbi:putative transport protein [Enterobacter cloacae]|uniref:Putative transport protein n=1 Tax=Enterobacter cloacae TaxID=550 RepID=A0A377LZL0_ENTCL|nr:putative transport protein [Enterobacter cloacae]